MKSKLFASQPGTCHRFWSRLWPLTFCLLAGLNSDLTVFAAGQVVAVFDDPRYVDTTSGDVSAESDNVQASLIDRGFAGVTFTNIVAGAGRYRGVVFPATGK